MHSRRLISRAIAAVTLGAAVSGGAVLAHDSYSDSQVRIQSSPTVTQNGFSPLGRQDQQEQLSENISYADLNLATTSGARELKSRARDAANSICQKLGDDDESNLGASALEHQIQCVNGAIDEAMPQINRAISAERTRTRG